MLKKLLTHYRTANTDKSWLKLEKPFRFLKILLYVWKLMQQIKILSLVTKPSLPSFSRYEINGGKTITTAAPQSQALLEILKRLSLQDFYNIYFLQIRLKEWRSTQWKVKINLMRLKVKKNNDAQATALQKYWHEKIICYKLEYLVNSMLLFLL